MVLLSNHPHSNLKLNKFSFSILPDFGCQSTNWLIDSASLTLSHSLFFCGERKVEGEKELWDCIQENINSLT